MKEVQTMKLNNIEEGIFDQHQLIISAFLLQCKPN